MSSKLNCQMLQRFTDFLHSFLMFHGDIRLGRTNRDNRHSFVRAGTAQGIYVVSISKFARLERKKVCTFDRIMRGSLTK
jgi:hypothetical protein